MFYNMKSNKQKFTNEETKQYIKYGFSFVPVVNEGTFEIDVCGEAYLFFFKDIFPIIRDLNCSITITDKELLLNN